MIKFWSFGKRPDDLDSLKFSVEKVKENKLMDVDWELDDVLRNEDSLADIIIMNWNENLTKTEDIYLIFKDNDYAKIKEITENICAIGNFNIKSVVAGNIHSDIDHFQLFDSGYSVKNKDFMNNIAGAESCLLIDYSLKGLDKHQKVRFVHALKGRKKNSGILSELNGSFKGKGCLIVPLKNAAAIRKFMNHWKVGHSEQKILVRKNNFQGI